MSSSEAMRLMPGEVMVDLFCGGGGWDEGAKEAGVHCDFAVNHDAGAIATHTANNPHCVHHQGDAWKARPREVTGGRPIGLFVASAACTTHSRARGAAPISKRVHMLGWCIARWFSDASPRVGIVENVPEWVEWGPMVQGREKRGDGGKGGGKRWAWTLEVKVGGRGRKVERRAVRGPKAGTPAAAEFVAGHKRRGVRARPAMIADPKRKGQHFRSWWRYCEGLGYKVEMRVLDAPDYGAACRRKRLFIILRRDGEAITWPERTHGDARGGNRGERGRDQVLGGTLSQACRSTEGIAGRGAERHKPNGSGCGRAGNRHVPGGVCQVGNYAAYRTAAQVIDWSDLGTSIFDRPKPLKEKTLRRIAEGIRRYVIGAVGAGVGGPFVLRVTHGDGRGWKVSGIDDALPTVTTRHDLGVTTPVIGVCAHGDGKDGTERWGRGALPLNAPLNAIHAGGNNFAVASPIFSPAGGAEFKPAPVDEPYHAILTREDTGLATPVLLKHYGGVVGSKVDKALGTVTTVDHHGIAVPVMATTGYGEREGQRPRCHDVSSPLVTAVNGVKQGIAVPVMVNNTSGHTGGPVDGSMATVTTGGQGALAVPVLSYHRHGGGQHSRPDEPMATITSGGLHAGVVIPLVDEYYGNADRAGPVDGSLGTPTTRDRQALIGPVWGGKPGLLAKARAAAAFMRTYLADVVSFDAEGLAFAKIGGEILYFVDLLFRMLQPSELARAMGFREDFIWPKTKRETVKLIGNAVSPCVARALVEAVLRPRRERVSVAA